MTIEQERSGDSGFVQDSEPCRCQNSCISFQEGKMSALAVSAEIGSVSSDSVSPDSGRQKIPYIGMCDLLPKGTLHHWRSVREAYSIRFPLLYSSAFNPSEV